MAGTLLGILAAPWVVTAMASGLRGDARGAEFGAAVWMTRMMFPYILCMSLVAFASGVLNTWRRFAVPAFTPMLLNLSMIARSEQHTFELQSLMRISYVVFCLKKKK